MEKFTELVSEVVGGERYSYYPLGHYIVSAIGVCGGRPTFKYTRIEVAGVLELLAAGDTVEQLVIGYRGRLSREAIAKAQRKVEFSRPAGNSQGKSVLAAISIPANTID